MKPFDAQATPLKVGDVICSYKIEHVQEQDEFFITYVANFEDVKYYPDRRVLIKEYMPIEIAMRGQNSMVVPRSPDVEEDFYRGLEAFIFEAEKLAKIEHDNVIPVWLNFETNGTGYMVTRHRFEIITLEDTMCLSLNKPLFGKDARAWFVELLEGLADVHSNGVVHGNISPKSIVVSMDGTDPALMNFGSVRNTLGKLRHNLPEVLASGYAPVEQYGAKDEEQGPWIDVYALGAVMIHCLTGIDPINARERQERMANGEQDPLLAHLIPAQKKGKGSVAEQNILDPLRVLEKQIEQLPDSLKNAPAKEKLAALRGYTPDSVMEFLKTAEDLSEKSELTESTYTRLLAEMVMKQVAMEHDSLEGPKEKVVEIAPKLYEVISRCVAVPYTERFQNATQVLQALGAYVPFILADGQAPSAAWGADSIPSPTPRTKISWGKWIRRGLFITVCALFICANQEFFSLKFVQMAAEFGNADAQNSMGERYLQGRGVDKDSVRARSLFQKASEQNNPAAQYNMGSLYEKEGQGTENALAQAADLYTQAANAGNAGAQYKLGVFYAEGIVFEKNPKKAVYWYTRAARQEHLDAQYALWTCYKNGFGVEERPFVAMHWLRKAAEQGLDLAQRELSTYTLLGYGVSKNASDKALRAYGEKSLSRFRSVSETPDIETQVSQRAKALWDGLMRALRVF